MPDERSLARVPIEAVVHFRAEGGMEVADAVSLTPEEIVLATPHPPSEGAHLRLRFALEGGRRFLLPGEVVALDDFDSYRKAVTVRFLDLADADREVLAGAWRDGGGEELDVAEPEIEPAVPEQVENLEASFGWDEAVSVLADPEPDPEPDPELPIEALPPPPSIPIVEPAGGPPVEIEAAGQDHTGAPVFRVTYHSTETFLEEYRSNLGKGGFFLPTEQSLERLAPVTIEIVLPGTERLLRLSGRVVHRTAGDPAKGSAAGLGIHFLPGAEEDLVPAHELVRLVEAKR